MSPRLAILGPGLLLGITPGSASAHIGFAANDLYAGMLHPVLHFPSLLLLIALALWISTRRETAPGMLVVTYLGAAVIGAGLGWLRIPLPDTAILQLPLALLFGILVATDRAPPGWATSIIVALVGLTEGFGNFSPVIAELTDPLLYFTGLMLTLGLIPMHLIGLLYGCHRLWVRTAARIVGSWTGTAAALVLALQWTNAITTVTP